MNKGEAHILIAANSVNGTKGGLGSSYLGTIIKNYAAELRAEYPDAISAWAVPLPFVSIRRDYLPESEL